MTAAADTAVGVNPANITEPERRALVRKLYVRILPILFFLYLFSFLDRVSIGNSRLYDIEKDLSISATQFSWSISGFFIGYVLLQWPSNLMLKKTSPRTWIAFITFAWGITASAMAFSQSFQGLLVLRVLLGCAEAGLVPGCIYYLSFWFCKNEQATATAIFMAAPSVSGIIGGFLASAIGHMHGTAGWSAWRWLFLLEGLPSFVLCAVVLIWLPNYPATAKFLSEKERAYAASRIEHDSHGQSKEKDSECAPVTTKDDEEHTGEQQSQLQQQQQQQQHSEVVLSKERKRELFWQEVRATVFDWYNIAICICKFCYAFIGYSLKLLMPTLLHKLGFKATDAQLLTVPHPALELVLIFVVSRISDIKGVRSIYLIIGGSLSSALFLALTIMGEHGLWSKYVLLILSNIPGNILGPIITAWGVAMNNRSATVLLPSSKDTNGHLDEKDNQERLIQLEEYREATKVRLATFTAIMFMSSNIGGIVSGFSFPEWDAPGYRFSQGINTALMIVYTVLIIAMHISIKRFNSRQPPSAWSYPI